MKKRRTKEKINPLMKDQTELKNARIKSANIESEDENMVKKFIIITIVIAIIIGGLYAFTELIKKEEEKVDEVKSGEIAYDVVTVGTILNRPYETYYVLIYNFDDTNAVKYSSILTNYMRFSNNDDYIKAYYCDLSNSLNSKYYNVHGDNSTNKNAKRIEEFNFGDLTLLQIKNGKIVKYIEDYETIKKELQYL